MNRTQLLSRLEQYKDDDHLFFSTLNDELRYQELSSLNLTSIEQTQLYQHPDFQNMSFVLIKELKAVDFIKKLFSSWKQGLIPLILSPELSDQQTLNLTQTWKLTEKTLTKDIKKNEELLFFISTSGSTGIPKLVGHDLKNVQTSFQLAKDFFKTNFPTCWGLTLPHWHIGGLMVILRMFFNHSQIKELKLKEPESLIKSWKQINGLSLVPTQLQTLLNKELCWKHFKLVLIGGASCPDKLVEKALKKSIPLSVSYGSSETCSLIAATKREDLDLAIETKKILLNPFEQVQFSVDTLNQQLFVQSPTLYKYLIKQGGTQKNQTGDLWKTQDKAAILPGKKIEIRGRLDNVFISGGENVSCSQVEKLILQNPDIEQAVLIPRPDEKFGQVGHLLYRTQRTDHLELERELTAQLQKSLAPHERPKSYALLPEYQELKFPRQKWQKETQEKQQNWADKPDFIFIHGFMGLQSEFDPIVQRLRDVGVPPWKLKAIKLPGHDGAFIPKIEKTFSALIKEFHKVMEKTIQGPCLIYAYSMGGRLTLSWLQEYGIHQQLKGLILESVHPGGLNQEERKKREKADQALFSPNLKVQDFQKFLEKWSTAPLFEGLNQTPDFHKQIQEKCDKHHPRKLYQALQMGSVSQQPDCTNVMTTLIKTKKPVIYLSGAKDSKYTVLGKDLAQKTGLNHLVHPDSSHNIHSLRPQWCSQIIQETITELVTQG